MIIIFVVHEPGLCLILSEWCCVRNSLAYLTRYAIHTNHTFHSVPEWIETKCSATNHRYKYTFIIKHTNKYVLYPLLFIWLLSYVAAGWIGFVTDRCHCTTMAFIWYKQTIAVQFINSMGRRVPSFRDFQCCISKD